MVLLIGVGPWRVGATWGGFSGFLSDFGSFCVRMMSGGSSRGIFGVSTDPSRHGWELHAYAGNSILGLVDLAVQGW